MSAETRSEGPGASPVPAEDRRSRLARAVERASAGAWLGERWGRVEVLDVVPEHRFEVALVELVEERREYGKRLPDPPPSRDDLPESLDALPVELPEGFGCRVRDHRLAGGVSEPCRPCGGGGQVGCAACVATGRGRCADCDGRKRIERVESRWRDVTSLFGGKSRRLVPETRAFVCACDGGEECSSCGGNGLVPCSACAGDGEVERVRIGRVAVYPRHIVEHTGGDRVPDRVRRLGAAVEVARGEGDEARPIELRADEEALLDAVLARGAIPPEETSDAAASDPSAPGRRVHRRSLTLRRFLFHEVRFRTDRGEERSVWTVGPELALPDGQVPTDDSKVKRLVAVLTVILVIGVLTMLGGWSIWSLAFDASRRRTRPNAIELPLEDPGGGGG